MTDTAARIDRPVPNRPLKGYLARARRQDAKAIAEFKKGRITVELLTELLAEAEHVTDDAGRWALIRRAWEGYLDHGASHFDWDYDTRDLMSKLSDRPEWNEDEPGAEGSHD